MNTTYGHQEDTIVWYSPNWLWSIECRTVYKRNGDIDHRIYRLYNQREGVLWDTRTIEGNEFFPKYVRAAIARHVPEGA